MKAVRCARGYWNVLLLQLVDKREMLAERASGKVLVSSGIVWLLESHSEGYVEGVS